MANGGAAAAAQQQHSAGAGPPPPPPPALRLEAVCTGHSRAVSGARFSPAAELLASVSADCTLRLWRVPDLAEAGPTTTVTTTTTTTPAAPAAAAAGGAGGDVEMTDAAAAAAPGSSDAAGATAGAAGEGAGGPRPPPPAATTTTTTTTTTQQQLVQMRHDGGVNDVDWSPSGAYLATAADDLTARLWDAETGSCLLTLRGHTNYVFCCQFNPQGSVLATGSFDETVRFWDVRTGRCLRELPAHSDPVVSLDFNHDGTVLATCSFDGLLRLWDAHNGHCLKTVAVDDGASPLSLARFCPNGRYVLQGSLDDKLRLLNYETGRVARTYSGHSSRQHCCVGGFVTTFGPRPLVAAGSEDGAVLLWDVDSKAVAAKAPGRAAPDAPGDGHCAAVLCVAAHPWQALLASCGQQPDNTIRLWSPPPAKAAAA